MRFGIHYGYWAKEWDADVEPLCKRAARLGIRTLEISAACIIDKTETELRTLKMISEREKVEIVCGLGMPESKNIAARTLEIREAGLDYIKDIITRASKAGINTITGILYASWFYDASKPVFKEEARAYSIDNMRIVADYAKQYGISLMMEVCNRFATYMLNTAFEAVEYVKKVDRENVKVMLDTFHMNVEEDNFAAAIKTAGQYLGYIHICENNRKLPGQGHLPWHEIIGALKEIKYNGPLVYECIVNMDGTIAHDLKTWRELRADYNEDGKDRDLCVSIAYLEKIASKFD